MRRLMLYDRLGNPLGELAEADVFEAILREEINGEHSLTITTTRVLDKGIRMLYQDGRSKWREFVVAGVDAEHASGNRAIGTYYCVWSVQQDLQGVTVSVMPGVQSPTTAALALTSLLSTTSRWVRGTVTQTSTGGASMYDRSAWEALSALVDVWGGEVDTTITIGTQSGVVGRAVDLYAAQGEQTAMRRFDFGADLISVKRTLADDPLFCRISPRGKGEQTDAGGYGRKITIESVNGGVDWLEYAPMVDAAKLPDGNGGYEYPTLIVENSDCETPADLKAWGESVLAQYCTPKVTYEIDVLQAGVEGVDVSGVSLGDAVQVVDRKFGGDGIRVQGRVRSITTDLLNERDITIVIGDAEESISSKFANVNKSLSAVNNNLTVMSTAEYIDNLLERINTEINATGGYTYIVPGHGILTFDVAVADPLNPVEASQVVEVKGGTIRIANSKTAQGAWEWKTVFTSGHIAAEVVTAANIITGYIGSASSGNYWDLDSGVLTVASVDEFGAMIHAYNDGVLVCRRSEALGALVNADGSFDVVKVSWSGNTPTVGDKYATFSDTSAIINHRFWDSSASDYRTYTGVQLSRAGSYIGTGLKAENTSFACGSGAGFPTDGSGIWNPDYKVIKASGRGAFAGGYATVRGDVAAIESSGYGSFAFGYFYINDPDMKIKASGDGSVAFGYGCVASGDYSFACGQGNNTSSANQFACGKFNSNSSSNLLEVGNGYDRTSRANAFRVTTSNTAYVGSTQVTSDRRVKKPLGDISEQEAIDFVHSLKPSKFEKFGRRELGFYAQDVEETNLGEYLVDESNDHGYEDFKNLSYDGLIAPLVAYCQHLEKRVDELEKRIEELEKGRC